MKHPYWKTIMYLSVLATVLGFATALTGAYTHYPAMTYVGFGIVIAVWVFWWVWVMLMIKVMLDFTNNAALRISDLKHNIKEVRQLFNEYKKLRNR